MRWKGWCCNWRFYKIWWSSGRRLRNIGHGWSCRGSNMTFNGSCCRLLLVFFLWKISFYIWIWRLGRIIFCNMRPWHDNWKVGLYGLSKGMLILNSFICMWNPEGMSTLFGTCRMIKEFSIILNQNWRLQWLIIFPSFLMILGVL